jgi:hypothetical protein
MRISIPAAFALIISLAFAAQAQKISGDYIETRNADVWTSACIANSEINLGGDQAILAWHIDKGSWNGVALAGLNVVGVVKASATLGDQFNNPYPARAVIIVDDKANESQRKALVGFAQQMTGELLRDVVEIKVAPILVTVGANIHEAKTSVKAGNLVGIETRAVGEHDHMCGNEAVWYSPLTKLEHSMPAVAELDKYDGPDLGVIWTLHGKRSAFVGGFSL